MFRYLTNLVRRRILARAGVAELVASNKERASQHEARSDAILRSLVGRRLARVVYASCAEDDRVPALGDFLSHDPYYSPAATRGHRFYNADWSVGLRFDDGGWCSFDWSSEASVSYHLGLTERAPSVEGGCCILADRFEPWRNLVGSKLRRIEAYRMEQGVLHEVILHFAVHDLVFLGTRDAPAESHGAMPCADSVLVAFGLAAVRDFGLGPYDKHLARTVIQ